MRIRLSLAVSLVVALGIGAGAWSVASKESAVRAGKTACANLDPTKFGDDNPLPEYADGTLILGPYLVGLTDEDVSIRWEVQSKQRGVIRIKGPHVDLALEGKVMPQRKLVSGLPGVMHEVEVEALKPCTEYRYRLEPFEYDGFPHRFRTAPRTGEQCPDGTRFIVYGDSRTHHNTHTSLMPAVISAGAHFAVHVGDFVFKARRVYEWQKFLQIESSFLASTPISVVSGNHERYRDKRFGYDMMYRYFLDGLNNGIGHYTFVRGKVHFTMIDLYFGSAIEDPETIKWLEKQLSEVPKGMYKFVILHDPVLTFAKHRPRAGLRNLKPIFERHGVTAVCAGHAHLYEHFQRKGVHYLTLGGMGANFHEPRTHVEKRYEKYFKKSAKLYHFLRVTVESDRLRFQIIDAKKSTVLDEWVVKEKP